MSESNADKMSSENKESKDESPAENKPSLTTITHKLKAEALRRLKLDEQFEGNGDSDSIDIDDERVGLKTSVARQEFEQGETKESEQELSETDVVAGNVNRAIIEQEKNSDLLVNERTANTNIKDNNEERSDTVVDENSIKNTSEQHGTSVSPNIDTITVSGTIEGHLATQETELDDKTHETSVPNLDVGPTKSSSDDGGSELTGEGHSFEGNIVHKKPDQIMANDQEGCVQADDTIENNSNSSGKLNSSGSQDRPEPQSLHVESINSVDASGDTIESPEDQSQCKDKPLTDQTLVGQLDGEDTKTSNGGFSQGHPDIQDSISVNNANVTTKSQENILDITGLQTISDNTTNGGETKANIDSLDNDKTLNQDPADANTETVDPPLLSADSETNPDIEKILPPDIVKKNELENDNKQSAYEENNAAVAIDGTIDSLLKDPEHNENERVENPVSEKSEDKSNSDQHDIDGDEMTSPLKAGDGENMVAGEPTVPGESLDNNDLSPSDGEGNEVDTSLADDFYYEKATSLFKPLLTEGVPQDLLSLHHSFGYECTKRENLHILDTNTVVFSAGNLVQILDLKTMEHTYIGGTNNGGIGAITVHPSRQYFAVAEKGVKPNINIYEYPSLKLFRVLREGTLEAFAHMNFSPHGTKLASLGGSPDFMLTVWDWRNEKVILRSKAFSQDVYKVAFSPENEGHLCTSGSGHIRFWTMANTFTGLKLQGELGRFGTTELTDIEGFVELPDGKVLSGSEWGNMLLWDGGLIKVEICKKGKKLCHNGMIEQFFMDEGELMTIGADGFIKVWDFEGIDNADITDEKSRVFEMEPMYEIKVGTDVKLKSMVKSVNPNTPTVWYGQDASGAIWKLDLSFTHTSHAPEKLFSFHAGIITCVEVSPINHLVATCGLDCSVRLYDYLDKLSLCSVKYSSAATSLLWLPKTVDPKCTSILCGFSDGVVRYLSVARDDAPASRNKRNKSNLEFQLVQVFKPHTKSVTSIVLDKRGKMLATGSEDCTVFFFAIEDSCKPIGFIETASPVVSMSWLDNTQDPGGILVFCKDGAVLDVEVPRTGTVDTNKSFRIPLQDLVKREYMFTRVKDKLLKAEEDERQAKIKEEKEKRKEEERKRRRARGIEEDETEEEEEEEEEDEETKEQDTETIDHGPSVTIRGFPSLSLDKFWMLMDGWDAGYIYECEFSEVSSEDSSVAKEPINAIKLLDCGDAPVRSYTYCNSGDFVLFGMEDGVIRIHPVHGKNVLDSLTTYWAVHLHDSHHGAITAIRTSFDDKYVFTVGTDGNFFVYNFSSDASLKESKPLVESSIPKIKTVIGEDGLEVAETIDDIDDPNYYSIELEKQKAEHDRMVKIAEEKKQNVRRVIAKFRRSFKSILAENQNLPEYLRIRAQELEIDPEIRKQQEAQSSEKIDLARKELAWESEKHTIGLKKLQDRFKSMMECDRIILYACGSSHKVASFRSSKLSELYDSLKESLDSSSKGKNASLGNNQKKMSVAGVKGALTGKRKSIQVDTRKKSLQPTSGGQVGGNVAKALEKAEQRRLKRELRQAEWDALYSNKPDDNYQDPKDLSAIKEASDNMGDYKLKTAGDYVVPEGQRVNAEIKLMQLLQLLDQIHYYKTYFNRRLLVLRDKKMRIIEEVKECVNSLKHLQTEMDPATHKPVPTVPKMKPEELPERKLVYDKEMLYSFKKQLEIKKEKKEEEDDGGGGGFGGFGVSESKPPQSNAGSRDRTFSNVSVLSGGRPKSNQSMKITDQITSEAILENVEEQLTPLEIQLKNQEQIKMKYEQDRLLKIIHFLLTNFDGELKTLRHEKSQFEVTLKNADLRHVTLFEELVLLKEFEKRENIFANRVKIKGNEKQDMEEKVDNCQVKLDIKKEEIEKYQEQEKALYATFSAMIGENNKFDGFLTKVFKKKIKRAKKKDESRDGSEEGSDEDDSDEDFSSSEESNSDEETLDDAVCPPGCDQALFDKVCELRESRLDIEESLTEEKKALEALKKEHEALNKRAKVIDSALSTAESELEAFQREKQQKLNELDVVVTIKLHQIQYIINNAMPQDLSSCLVFISSDHNRLQKRIKELEVEKAEQKRLFREHRQMHVQLKRDKKAREAEISELEEKVKNMQMLKFGRLVDFERLENVSVNRNAEELKERLRQQEFQNATELSKWEKKIQSYREKLTLRTRENTERLNTSTTLFHERQELEQKLDSKQKSLGAEYSGNREADVKERHRLVQLVQLQAQEIDALKDEITLMSRKGGHILPPSQPPLPTSQTAIPNM